MTKTTPKYALSIVVHRAPGTTGNFVGFTGFAYPAKDAGPATDENLAKHLALVLGEDFAIIESATVVEQATNTIVAEYAAA